MRDLFIFCVDVGSPKNIGWANSNEDSGDYTTFESAVLNVGDLVKLGQPVAFGFEAPVWTPRRNILGEITQARRGLEKDAVVLGQRAQDAEHWHPLLR